MCQQTETNLDNFEESHFEDLSECRSPSILQTTRFFIADWDELQKMLRSTSTWKDSNLVKSHANFVFPSADESFKQEGHVVPRRFRQCHLRKNMRMREPTCGQGMFHKRVGWSRGGTFALIVHLLCVDCAVSRWFHLQCRRRPQNQRHPRTTKLRTLMLRSCSSYFKWHEVVRIFLACVKYNPLLDVRTRIVIGERVFDKCAVTP